ncbi:hypothetical protein M8997_003845 [Phyllobacterium sp. 21LDTY02-6]|uniref:hypothetical protein n=1 Tax=Phyllobacterium sp. 21LDTY02-6 TaxID=2944903 RepID=UPI00208E967F|nr:hypothetical protein [Phyllobacterium sp. 21LDTY02-6]MCO4316305.1 hypothetical protein [Phyllobacterium sp. 21LDTY02-6]
MNAPAQILDSRPPVLMVGGSVNAIVPQSIEEIWRVSKMVVMAGLAPKALVGKKTGEDAVSAVAISVMAGAELGLPPMVALRSFTVIGGRPALYGDGIINVVRRSKKAAYIRTGYDEARGVGWCEAKRSDTGEEKRTEFSVADAKRAGLWDDRPTVKKQDWNTKQWNEVPNEAPWFRYPQRMQQWRSAGYCLRELFADVLGGITDEYEAREIAGESYEPERAKDITPPSPTREIAVEQQSQNAGEAVTDIEPEQRSTELSPPPATKPAADLDFSNPAEVIADAETRFACVQDEGDWEELRSEFAHLQETFFPVDWDKLVDIMQRAYDRVIE